MSEIESWKYELRNVTYKVHIQITLLEHRATIHCVTRTTLASLLFGSYFCHLCNMCSLTSRRGLLSTSRRLSFGLFLSVAILGLLLRWYSITDPGCTTSGPISAIIFPFVTIIMFAVFLDWKALDEIFQSYIPLQFSETKISTCSARILVFFMFFQYHPHTTIFCKFRNESCRIRDFSEFHRFSRRMLPAPANLKLELS